jgi:hypothetical protein
MPNTTLLGSTPPPHEADLFLMTLGEAAEINLFLVEKTLQISAYFLPPVAACRKLTDLFGLFLLVFFH